MLVVGCWELLLFVLFVFGRVSLASSSTIVSPDSSPAYNNYTFNCLNAKEITKKLEYCHMVHWVAASAFNTSTYSDYYPSDKLPIAVQDQRAHDFYDSLYTKNGESDCRQAVKRLACAMFFPE